jgi:hypothetical protein
MVDAWVSEVKAKLMQENFGTWDSNLPAYRETMIQLAKLERMAADFQKRFPRPVLLLTALGSKPSKTEGEHKHRLQQQNKLVDRLFRKLIEQRIIALDPRVSARNIRGMVKFFVEGFNRVVHKRLKDAILNVSLEQIKGLDQPGVGASQRALKPRSGKSKPKKPKN